MSTSEARSNANRANALKSTGPKTEAGKLPSRINSLWHGLAGSGAVLLPAGEAKSDDSANSCIATKRPTNSG